MEYTTRMLEDDMKEMLMKRNKATKLMLDYIIKCYLSEDLSFDSKVEAGKILVGYLGGA